MGAEVQPQQRHLDDRVLPLLGTHSGRRIGGSAIKLGSLAALGRLAYKTCNDWQAQQQAQQQASAPAAAAGATTGATLVPLAPLAPLPTAPLVLPAPQTEAHSRVLLKALIAAAKCGCHLDDWERALVEAELRRSEAAPLCAPGLKPNCAALWMR